MREPTPAVPAVAGNEAVDRERSPVHEWRVAQLTRLGVPKTMAEADADYVDWHQVAGLVQRGCAPRLALRIARLRGPITRPPYAAR
jgi:hypothetical protein